MRNMTKFQLIFTGIFAAFIVIGVLVFSLSRGGSGVAVSKVTFWGTLPENQFSQILRTMALDQDKTFEITYVEKRPENFDKDFVEALADGKGPDLFMVPQTSLLKHESRIFPIPYTSFSERDFRDLFTEGSEVFLTQQGILAIPYVVDPLVMYWNRTLFTNEGLAREPRFWEELYSLTSRLTKKDGALNITQTTAPFGEFRNITNAKSILSMLTLQAGSPIISRRASDGKLASVFSEKFGMTLTPAGEALRFFTDFSNPSTIYYSWNRSLPISQNFFTAGDSALYFGFASELPVIQKKNPNLNFDVASVPQSRQAKVALTFGNFYGLAISKNSKDIAGAFRLAFKLIDQTGIQALVDTIKLPPVRRDLLSSKPSDAYMSVFYDSALKSKTWLDPDATETSRIFQSMIEDVTSGRASISESINRANSELQLLIK